MKLFWKVFFSTMTVCILCFALGGYILIQSSFSTQLKRECEAAYNQNEVVSYALDGEFIEEYTSKTQYSSNKAITESLLMAAKNIDIFQSGNKLEFILLNDQKKVLYNSIENTVLSPELLEHVTETKRGYVITDFGNQYRMQTIIPTQIARQVYYIAGQRDITLLYHNQKQQLNLLLAVMCGMLILSGIMVYTVIYFALRRISCLTKATEDIAKGKLFQRIKVSGNDEITMLSCNFNQMAEDLESKIEELKENAKNRERFVGAFAHELKTPLTSIIGYSDMLRGKISSPERTQMCADFIFHEGKRLESLAMRLLELMVIKNQTIFLKNVDIPTLFEEVKLSVAPWTESEDIHIVWDIHSGTVAMEPNLMKDVFLNLIDNARKAIDGKGKILVRGCWKKDYYVVHIADNGRGMNEEELGKIKEAFYMADKSRSRKQGGVGLGLAICDEILSLHEFSVDFVSKPGRGTTVTVQMKGGGIDA